MTDERRTRLAPDERRAQLVSLGVAALADRSLDELTIDVLAQQAGVSRGLLFYYFGSKQGFHREVVRAARDGLLRATEPPAAVTPLERLHVTLTNLVAFVREHEDTFFSLVRGAASGDRQVREVVEQARVLQTERVETVCHELGIPESPLLRVALRSWVAFAEQALVDAGIGSDMPSGEIVAFLESSLAGIVSVVDPEHAARLVEGASAAGVRGAGASSVGDPADGAAGGEPAGTTKAGDRRAAAPSSGTSLPLVPGLA